MLRTLTPAEIRDAMRSRTDITLIDVREPAEAAIAAIDGAQLIPMRALPAASASLPTDHELIVYCHHGVRSEMAGMFLVAQGFPRVSHMAGGIDRWSDDIDSAIAKY